MRRIRIYTTRWCGYCVRAKVLLDSRQLQYEEISLDDDPAFRQTVHDATGGWTVPQILVESAESAEGARWLPIGGYTELWRLDREGRLDELLAA
jgi:glutaredoxin 3